MIKNCENVSVCGLFYSNCSQTQKFHGGLVNRVYQFVKSFCTLINILSNLAQKFAHLGATIIM